MLSRRTVTLAGTGCLLVVTCVVAWRVFGTPTEPELSPRPAGRSSLQQANRPLTDAEIRRCGECHAAECSHFAETPHARTLARSVADPRADRLTGTDGGPRSEDERIAGYRYVQESGRLFAEAGSPPSLLPADWLFGSGTHGVTPVSVRDRPGGPSEGLEMHLSWYASHGLALTFNHEDDLGDGIKAFGRYMPPSETVRCFQCHTTGLRFDERTMRIDFASFEPGVRCESCHQDARRHSDSGGEAPIERLSALPPDEAVRRCGECHRNADGLAPDELRPDNAKLARFATIGLPQSPCFRSQGTTRFDCATCHDPHTSAPKDPQAFVSKCLTCHGVSAEACSSQPLTSNCIPCHMPKVESETGVLSTDHWIRVREDVPPAGDPHATSVGDHSADRSSSRPGAASE